MPQRVHQLPALQHPLADSTPGIFPAVVAPTTSLHACFPASSGKYGCSGGGMMSVAIQVVPFLAACPTLD